MMADGADHATDQEQVKVVINDEEQYSIWPADRANPLGWRDGRQAWYPAGIGMPFVHRAGVGRHASEEPAAGHGSRV
jgi:hypothetical protein